MFLKGSKKEACSYMYLWQLTIHNLKHSQEETMNIPYLTALTSKAHFVPFQGG